MRWSFANLSIDDATRVVSYEGQVVALERKPLDVLLSLLHAEGELVTKEELFDSVWEGRIVTDGVLTQAIRRIREVLHDDQRKLVRTMHGLGFRLDGDIRLEGAETQGTRLNLNAGDPVPHAPDWQLEERLGHQPYHELWRARHPQSDDLCVFKFALNPRSQRALKREVTINRVLRQTAPDAVIPILSWELQREPPHIQLPWFPEGSLDQWVDRQGNSPGSAELKQRLALLAQAALAAADAHALGILHRDIKPGNILLERVGDELRALLCDFGSGSVRRREAIQAAGVTAMGFTQTQQAGSQSGTPAYLAPEVIAESKFSEQSEVFAFGVLLYQLSSGHMQRSLAPGWERDVPDAGLQRIIAQACASQIEHRTTNLKTFAAQIQAWTPQPARPRIQRWWPLGAAMLLAATVMAVFLRLDSPETPITADNPAREQRIERQAVRRQLTFSGNARFARISPDGHWLASVRKSPQDDELVVQQLPEGPEQSVYAAAYLHDMAWSPDSRTIAIVADTAQAATDVVLVGLEGQAPRSLGGPYCAVLDWFPDGRVLACAELNDRGFTLIDTHTLARTPFDLVEGLMFESALAVSPDGSWVVFAGGRNDGSGAIWRARPDGTELSVLLELNIPTAELDFAPDGRALYFFRRQSSKIDLMLLPVDPGSMQASGPPRMLEGALTVGPSAGELKNAFRSSLSLTSDGKTLVYTLIRMHAHLLEWPLLDTVEASRQGARQLTRGTSLDDSPDVSSDGNHIVFRRRQGAKDNLFVLNRANNSMSQITNSPSFVAAPGWSRDDRYIAFIGGGLEPGAQKPLLWVHDRTMARNRLVPNAQPARGQNSLRWTPDGRILYSDAQSRLRSILPDGADERAFRGDADPYVICPLQNDEGATLIYLRAMFAETRVGLWAWEPDTDISKQLIAGGNPCALGIAGGGQSLIVHDVFGRQIGELDIRTGQWLRRITLPFATVSAPALDLSQGQPVLVSSQEIKFSDAWMIENFAE